MPPPGRRASSASATGATVAHPADIFDVSRTTASALAAWGIALSSLVLTNPRALAAEARDWTVEDFRWRGTLAPATRLVVHNLHGDVRLRAADAGELELSAMIQRRTADPSRAVVDVERRGDRLVIEVGYPTPPQGDLHRVDLAVFVPAGARVAVRTRDGMIQARGLANDLRLRTVGGDVDVVNRGRVRVRTRGGDVRADLQGGQHIVSASRLRSRHGDVMVKLPPDADVRLRARAGGSLALPSRSAVTSRSARRAVLTLGDGNSRLRLRSVTGNVTVTTADAS